MRKTTVQYDDVTQPVKMEIVEYPRDSDKGDPAKDMAGFLNEHVHGDHAGLNIQTWTVLALIVIMFLVAVSYFINRLRMKKKRSYSPPAFTY